MVWNDSTLPPSQNGWYSILQCHDPHEGFFPMASYWDGKKWNKPNVSQFGDKCDTEEEAEKLAEKHDPNW